MLDALVLDAPSVRFRRRGEARVFLEPAVLARFAPVLEMPAEVALYHAVLELPAEIARHAAALELPAECVRFAPELARPAEVTRSLPELLEPAVLARQAPDCVAQAELSLHAIVLQQPAEIVVFLPPARVGWTLATPAPRARLTFPQFVSQAWFISACVHAGIFAVLVLVLPALVVYPAPERFTPIEVVREPLERKTLAAAMWPEPEAVQLVDAPATEAVVMEADAPRNDELNELSEPLLAQAAETTETPDSATMVIPVKPRHKTASAPLPPRPPAGPAPASRKAPGITSHASVTGLEIEYPEKQRQAGRAAVVVVLVNLDRNGRVVALDFPTPHAPQDFMDAARRAIQHAHFSPSLQNGEPVPGKLKLKLIFQFKK